MRSLRRVQQSADTAPHEHVFDFSQALPREVALEECAVFVYLKQIFGQITCRLEVVHVNERVGRRESCVCLRVGAHHDGNDVIVEGVNEELFGDILKAIGIFKCQVKLVVLAKHAPTRLLTARALTRTTAVVRDQTLVRTSCQRSPTEHVNCYVLLELTRELHAPVIGLAIGYEPRDL